LLNRSVKLCRKGLVEENDGGLYWALLTDTVGQVAEKHFTLLDLLLKHVFTVACSAEGALSFCVCSVALEDAFHVHACFFF